MVRKIPKRAFEKVTSFEALVVSYKMDESDGGMIRLTMYVDNIGDGDWLMNVYPRTPIAVGIKPLDYDNPDESKVKTEGERTLGRFSLLCRQKKFQLFMEEITSEEGVYGWGMGKDENECVKALKNYLAIDSRRELLDDYRKIEAFQDLVQQFEEWVKCH